MPEPQTDTGTPDAAPPPPVGDAAFNEVLKQASGVKAGAEKAAVQFEASADRTRDIGKQLAELKMPEPPPQTAAPAPPPTFQETEPLQAFGSLATALGALGGLLTRAPLTASLNAASSAMNSIRSRDLQNFDVHLKEWKAQSEHAINVANWQNERYRLLMEKYKGKTSQLLTAVNIEAAANQDTSMAQAARTGALDVVEKLWKDRSDITAKLKEQRLRADEFAETKRRNAEVEAETRRYHDILRDKPLKTSAGNAFFAELLKKEEELHPGEPVTPDRMLELRTLASVAESGGKIEQERLKQQGQTDRTAATVAAREKVALIGAASREAVAEMSTESREKVAGINADSRTQAAEIRAQAQRDGAAIRAQTAGDRLDFDYDKLAQTKWGQEEKNRLVRLGLSERAAEAEMRERVATAKVEADRYKTDRKFDADTAKINLARELGGRKLDINEQAVAGSNWAKTERARLDELKLGQRATEALMKERIAEATDATRRYVADQQVSSRDRATDKRFEAAQLATDLKRELGENAFELGQDKIDASKTIAAINVELKARQIEGKEADAVRKAVFAEAKEEHRQQEALTKLGQGDMKLDLQRTAQEMKAADSAEKRSQGWAKIAQYDQRLDQFDRKLEQSDVIVDLKRQGGARDERKLDLAEEKLRGTREYQDAALALKERGMDATQVRDQIRFRVAEWVHNDKQVLQDRVDARAKAKEDGARRLDQAIVNDLSNYPGLKREDLGFIDKANQTKIVQARHAAGNLEDIAEFVVKYPETAGLVAEIAKKTNLDTWQNFFNLGSDKAVTAALDKEVDRKGSPTAAARVKELNKMLVTQAFIDAATSGQRPSVYLDRVFREVYQQNSSPTTLINILSRRYKDADKILSDYRMGFSERTDKAKFPLWNTGPEGYGELVKAQEKARKNNIPLPVIHSEAEARQKLKKDQFFIDIDEATGVAQLKQR